MRLNKKISSANVKTAGENPGVRAKATMSTPGLMPGSGEWPGRPTLLRMSKKFRTKRAYIVFLLRSDMCKGMESM